MTITIDEKDAETLIRLVYLGRMVVNGYRDPRNPLREVDALTDALLRQCLTEVSGRAPSDKEIDRLYEQEGEKTENLVNEYWLGAKEDILSFLFAIRQFPQDEKKRLLAEIVCSEEFAQRGGDQCVRFDIPDLENKMKEYC